MSQPSTRSAIREAAAKALGAYFQGVLSVATVNPHTALTVPKIGDVAMDAERFQYWYVMRNAPAAVTVTSSSAASPTTVTCAAAHFVAPGDKVTIAGHSNTALNGTFTVLTTPADTTFTVAVAAAYAGGTGGSFTINDQYRLITATGLPAALTITIQRAFQGGAAFTALPAGTVLDFYLILTLDEWNTALNTAFQDKFYKDRLSIVLVAGQTEYDLTDATKAYYAPWFQSKGQFIRGRFRDASTTGAPIESEIPVIYFEEVDYGVKVIMPSLPSNVASVTAELEARHYYSAITADSATITLPERLAVAAAKDEALKLIFQKLGPAAKRVYGMGMVLSERTLSEQEARWLDNSARRDMSDEEMPWGGDPERGISWGW